MASTCVVSASGSTPTTSALRRWTKPCRAAVSLIKLKSHDAACRLELSGGTF